MRLTACSVPELEKNAKIERIEKEKTRHNCQICSVHIYHMLFDHWFFVPKFLYKIDKTLACIHDLHELLFLFLFFFFEY